MRVAFDIAHYPIFRDGDLFYPGVASLLSIINCGGEAVIFDSRGDVPDRERRLIGKLVTSFKGKIFFARNAEGTDMSII